MKKHLEVLNHFQWIKKFESNKGGGDNLNNT